MATHSSILAWEIPWTEEPGELQSLGLQRVRHDLLTKTTNSRTKFVVRCYSTLTKLIVDRLERKLLRNSEE